MQYRDNPLEGSNEFTGMFGNTNLSDVFGLYFVKKIKSSSNETQSKYDKLKLTHGKYLNVFWFIRVNNGSSFTELEISVNYLMVEVLQDGPQVCCRIRGTGSGHLHLHTH